MWERLFEFAPSFGILLLIIITTFLFYGMTCLLYGKKSFNNKWYQKNFLKVYCLTEGLESCVLAPAAEEMIFRLPIIFLFPQMTVVAGIAIAISSIIWGAVHWSNYAGEKTSHRIAKMMVIAISGILYGVIGVLLQTIWIPVALHVAWNLSCCVGEYIEDKNRLDQLMKELEAAELVQAEVNCDFPPDYSADPPPPDDGEKTE